MTEPKNTGKFGKGNPGKPKGALNKTTQAAKDAIAQAAAELGGAARLVEWVREDTANERVFWGTIYPKLLPLQVNGAGENGEHLFTGIRVEFVRPDADGEVS
jgi:hypothetical protein